MPSTTSSPTLQGKVIALTGGASGIGLATAKILASLGAKVSIADVSAEALESVAKDIKGSGGEVFTKVTDVRKRDMVEAWVRETVETFGALDGAANLAGVIGKNHGKMLLADHDDEEWDFVMDVNLKGVRNCMRAQINAISDGGSIVNAASICGLIGLKGCSAYCASKHAVIGLTRSAAKEVGSRNVRVNCIAPGVTETPMLNQSTNASGSIGIGGAVIERRGQPEEIANAIVFLLSQGASFITGQCYSVDGGWNA
ncbi:3-oxoacyl-reductase [Amylocarpus encephaloides]|uniref:3-oxoacyl-reductase n=1 Tax=Amylocarpus encephaloides TaxID=45428 RepID=A0A9P7YQA1_9HELO|nr:3-oxoacyl-reductase [Amylocarpus encephaloides]